MSSKPTLQVIGYEPVQILQNKQRSIALLTARRTAIRVFLKPKNLDADINVIGTLRVKDAQGKSHFYRSISHVRLNRKKHPKFQVQRGSMRRALTFILEPELAIVDGISFKLTSLETLTGVNPGIKIASHSGASTTFEQGPTLRMRVVGFPVFNPETSRIYWPRDNHFEALRSYIERAYPISALEWSQARIPGQIPGFQLPFSRQDASSEHNYEWQHKHDIASAYLASLRAWEIEHEGVDPRTHYYGLVASLRNEFFSGAASNVVAGARPDLVAIGPAISDGSYGAHEIGHTLGGLHPGFPSNPLDNDEPPQQVEDKDFPPANKGRLSNPADEAHGFDVGEHDSEARVLKYSRWYDLLSWASPKVWISDYRFTQIRERLITEDAVINHLLPQKRQIFIAGRFSFDDQRTDIKNEILYAFKTRREALATSPTKTRIAIIGMDSVGRRLFKVYAEEHDSGALDLLDDSGVFNVTTDWDDNLDSLQIMIDNKPASPEYSYQTLVENSEKMFQSVDSGKV